MVTILKRSAVKIVLCTVVCNFIFVHQAQNVPVTLHEPLAIAMQATGAELSKAHITGNGNIAVKDASPESLKFLVYAAADVLKLSPENCTVEETASIYQQSVILSFHTEKEQITILAKQRKEKNAIKPYATFTVKISLNDPEEKAIGMARGRIFTAFEKIGELPQITTCLEGYLDGKLRNGEYTLRLRDAFDAIGAQLNSSVENERYVSYTGFSPLVQEKSIRAGGEDVNVNMAIRYHAYDHRTYVIVAAPVITMEY